MVDSAVNTMGFPVLSLIVLVTLGGALLVLCLKDDLQIKRLTLLVTTFDLALTLKLLVHFNPDTPKATSTVPTRHGRPKLSLIITAGLFPIRPLISSRIARAEPSGSLGSRATCLSPTLD